MPYYSQMFPIIFLVFLSVQADSNPALDQSMIDLHRSWMMHHNKVYHNQTEREKRFRIFQENIKHVTEFNNAGDKSYKLGINQFTDLTNEERVARFTGYRPPRNPKASAEFQHENVSYAGKLPKEWDWRKKGVVTPVKNQYCGNCWLYAGVGVVESLHSINTGELVELSEQEIMDCDDLPGKGGCNGGWAEEVFEYVKHYSLTTEKIYPTTGDAKTCDKSKRGKNRVARVTGFVDMPARLSDEELMKAVVRQPVAVVLDVSSRDFGAYKSGVFTGKCNHNLNHAMSIVGFGETEEGLKYWIVRNTWGEGWGDKGYIKIQRGIGLKEGLCGINLNPSYPFAEPKSET